MQISSIIPDSINLFEAASSVLVAVKDSFSAVDSLLASHLEFSFVPGSAEVFLSEFVDFETHFKAN